MFSARKQKPKQNT